MAEHYVLLAGANNSPIIAASQNRGDLKLFKLNNGNSLVTVPENAVYESRSFL